MRSHRFLTLVAFFGLSLFVLAGCAGNTDSAADQRSTQPSAGAPAVDQDATDGAADQDATDGAADANRISVDIANSLFSPAELRIKAGTTVVWTNQDAANHQVHDDSNAFKSDILGQGGMVEVNYSAPGTFTYHCHVHPNMKATVIVE